MALLAESLVEEWLNRNGFFTIRGLKYGAGEMDLLAVRPQSDGVIGWHVEVQVSFQPIGYIAKGTRQMVAEFGRGATYVGKRTLEQIEVCAREWVTAKFRTQKKVELRDRLWPMIDWSFHLVHGVVKYPREIEVFMSAGIECHAFHELLTELSRRDQRSFSGSAGGDLAAIVSYYKSHETGKA